MSRRGASRLWDSSGLSWTDFNQSKKIAIKGYAKAQTTLVSNTGQSNSGAVGFTSDDYAQPFGTGSHTAGYDFDSIVLSLGQAPSGTGTLTVTVRADASGDPSGTALHTLTNPDPFVADDLNTFPAPAGATLDANTTYWVVASYSSDSGGPNWWRVLLSNGIDSGGAAGWTIDSPYKFLITHKCQPQLTGDRATEESAQRHERVEEPDQRVGSGG